MGRALALLIGLVGLLAWNTRPANAAPKALDGLQSAEVAVRQAQAGDLRSAATTVRQALDAEPGSTLLHNLAASVLMMTGDAEGAASEWTSVLDDVPDDSLAIYGLGLVSLARGDRARARDQFQIAGRSGDRVCCLLAERYLESLNGAVGSGAGLVLPDAFAASAQGLSGMAAARAGDHRRALTDLAAALAALPGDPTAEPLAVLMTFQKEAPLRGGAPALPRGNGLARPRSRQTGKVYSGTVLLAPDNAGSDAGFVVFRIDGSVHSIVNTAPFQLVWDTARVPNGVHKVVMIVYDRRGQEITQAGKELRTANAGAPPLVQGDAARIEQVRSVLWSRLTLLPSRHTLAYTASTSALAVGDKEVAERFLEQAAAIDPDYADTRGRWAALTADSARPALWQGRPTENVVALTFDDGPKPGVTEMLLNVLKQEGVAATFFVIGRHTTANPDLTRKIAEAGMQIENHTYSHPNLMLLPPEAIERELLRTIASVRVATGRHMRYFRPPGGNMNGDVSRIAAQWGLTPCMWTVDGEALENGTGDQLVAYVLKHVHPGAIILLHNGRMTTIEALPRIIAGLRQRGFGFVTIDQLARGKEMAGNAGNAGSPGNHGSEGN